MLLLSGRISRFVRFFGHFETRQSLRLIVLNDFSLKVGILLINVIGLCLETQFLFNPLQGIQKRVAFIVLLQYRATTLYIHLLDFTKDLLYWHLQWTRRIFVRFNLRILLLEQLWNTEIESRCRVIRFVDDWEIDGVFIILWIHNININELPKKTEETTSFSSIYQYKKRLSVAFFHI